MVEVELKARLRDRAATLSAVSSFARDGGEVDKADEYWHEPDWRRSGGSRGFRIRTEDGASVVNYKEKRREGGIEINRESEFEVPDRDAFVEFLRRLGCEPSYAKRKRGRSFMAGGTDDCPDQATIEILEVSGLGDFIEIEILLESEDASAIASARREIGALLARSGVAESDIEPRFYSELLAGS